ncbi:MAG TPA: hypothetical protein PLQ00_06980 [Thermoguttaceae bacterium]|nr:hypothetical protein [Thermoguttaceae bacterium]
MEHHPPEDADSQQKHHEKSQAAQQVGGPAVPTLAHNVPAIGQPEQCGAISAGPMARRQGRRRNVGFAASSLFAPAPLSPEPPSEVLPTGLRSKELCP